MKIYVASSWKNIYQQSVVKLLRSHGYDVYDFKNPVPGDTGFSWKQIGSDEDLRDSEVFRDKVLTNPIVIDAFNKDMDALKNADATVLVLPCGRRAHLELGYATGEGQKTFVLLDDPMSEPELMYLMNTKICVSLDELIYGLRSIKKAR